MTADQSLGIDQYLIQPGHWKLTWICTFCLARHTWERRIPNDDAVREGRFQVAAALNSHMHCDPGCGRWITLGSVVWIWEADDE